jgi:glycerol-3-phosphate acyltransferase PlsX
MRIALDAMGSDYGPQNLVEGAILAVEKLRMEVTLIGKEETLSEIIRKKNFRNQRLSIVNAAEVVGMQDAPKESLRKRDSSVNVATQLVHEGEAAGLVSAGNTGATLASTLKTWRTLEGISRPAIATLLPTQKQPVVLLDVGANVDCKPRHLFQFGIMGAVYARDILHRPNPRVGLLSIGEESSKGNEQTLGAFKLLEQSTLNFRGNTEGRDILSGDFDVIVCDGFVGNIVLKFGESVAQMILHSLKGELSKNVISYLGALAMGPAFESFKKRVDYSEYGGAPLLGLNGVCIICHGESNPKAIMNAIRMAGEFVNHNVNSHILEELRSNPHNAALHNDGAKNSSPGFSNHSIIPPERTAPKR